MTKQKKSSIRTDSIAQPRAPFLRSANWALLIGVLGGCIFGAVQINALHGGWGWMGVGGLLGILLGVVVSGDLLIPGPAPRSGFAHDHGSRVGPFRWAVMLALLTLEGLIFGAYLWGGVTLSCERLASSDGQQVDCQRVTRGWFNSRQTGETIYDKVIGGSMSVHNELLLQHGAFEQSQAAAGFGAAELTAVQDFLSASTPALQLTSTEWQIRLGSPVCFAIALLCALWAYSSLRQGYALLRQQFAQGEVYWGWRTP